MNIYIKELPREQIVRKMTSKFGNLDSCHAEMIVRLFKFSEDLALAKEKQLQQWGLSEGRFHVLLAMWAQGGPIKATEIAQQLGVSRATMTGLVDSLMADELIKKQECEADRRAVYLLLSEKGQQLLESLLPEHVRCVREFSEVLTEEEANQLFKILGKLQVGLNKFIDEN